MVAVVFACAFIAALFVMAAVAPYRPTPTLHEKQAIAVFVGALAVAVLVTLFYDAVA